MVLMNVLVRSYGNGFHLTTAFPSRRPTHPSQNNGFSDPRDIQILTLRQMKRTDGIESPPMPLLPSTRRTAPR